MRKKNKNMDKYLTNYAKSIIIMCTAIRIKCFAKGGIESAATVFDDRYK